MRHGGAASDSLKGISLMTAVRARLMRRLLWTSCALVLTGSTLLAGCSSNYNIAYGTAVVTMNGVSGDFASYIVTIDSITLTRNDGYVAYPLSSAVTVDLARLNDLAELVETPAVPAGTYTTLTLALDYSTASIMVDVNGVPTAASAVDASGVALTVYYLTVSFDPANQLVINTSASTRLALDFNLTASSSIDLSTSPPKVTVRPFLTATVAPADQTVMRARGIFVVAQQPASGDYIVNMRPFADTLSALGALTVSTTSSTYFNVNGTTYTGSAGLAALQTLLVSTPVAAYGTLGSFATITPGFNATAVYAGTSLESPLADYFTGTVSAVNGNSLTLHGVTCVARFGWTPGYGVPGYFASVPVTVSPGTMVSEDGVAASGLSTRSISVGQLITVAGQATTAPYCALSGVTLSLDATGQAAGAPMGQVRLQPTPLWGTLNSAASGSMSLDVLSLGNFAPGAFTFTGTGTTSANDALPASYAVNTPGIDESATPAGTLLQAVGVVTPFGSAPPDFTASAVTPGSSTPQTLVVEWPNGAASPFSSASSAGLVVDLSNANLSSTVRYIATGPTRTDLTTLAASPTIAFASGTTLRLAVGPTLINGTSTIQAFNSTAGFASALSSALNGTNLVYRLACVGQYDAASNTFTATQLAVNL